MQPVENMGLDGFIDVDLLALLSNLRTISFIKNNFDGPLPDIKKLSALRSLYLSNNNFSGEIPYYAFSGMLRLKRVHLANNQFAGSIPTSLITLPKLLELRLEDNHFDVVFINHKRQPSLLTKAPVQPSNLQKKSGIKESNESGKDSTNRSGNTKKVEGVKLTFVREDREKFDMQELLKASAEILGSGSFGSSYKAALHNGQVMVVKRFKQMNNLGKEEFQEHMSKLGRLRTISVWLGSFT
ncbi:pollen receptor-like kinase 1 [Juglans regia]|uniref:Pollen receptor-like kinase 1 n=1 Tax=Juglans regia TaxID=51240 RepID=A0A6P9ES30_JUGRE|nr:pollen receptor-like kinase 1 [Juglans regia]